MEFEIAVFKIQLEANFSFWIPARNPQLFLNLKDSFGRLDDRVRIEGDAVDAATDQKLSKFRIVARSLAADAYLLAILFRLSQ